MSVLSECLERVGGIGIDASREIARMEARIAELEAALAARMDDLTRIAEVATAHEREACAKIADDCYESASVTHGPCAAAEYIARTIRARGSK
jgi:hypothetical protein